MLTAIPMRILCPFIFCLITLVFPASHYYYNEFPDLASLQADFDDNFRYGRGGVITGCATASTVGVTGGRIVFDGRVNNYDVDWIGTWVGRMVKFTNRTFYATESSPFGVVLVRKDTRFDPQHETGTFNNPESHRHLNAMSFWFFVETGLTTASNGESYSEFTLMYDMMRDSFNLTGIQPFSTWGRYVASEYRFDLTQARRPNFNTINIIDDTDFTLEWCYDENYGDGTGDGTHDGTANPNPVNTNTIGLMMTHNGSRMSFYINPNYDDTPANPYPNEFLFVGDVAVTWSSNISFMFGHESKRYDTELEYFEIESVLIRSVATNSSWYFLPGGADGTGLARNIIIDNDFSVNDAGVGEIEIINDSEAWELSDLKIYTCFGKGRESAVIPGLRQLNNRYTGDLAAEGEVLVRVTDDVLKLQFAYGTPADPRYNVIDSTAPDGRIVISYNTTGEPSGDYRIYIDCVRHDGTVFPKFATTGRQRSMRSGSHPYNLSALYQAGYLREGVK